MMVTWEVDDGYVGKARPQHTDIPDEELDECETEHEKDELIAQYVQGDFDNKISWDIVRTDPSRKGY
jgi:hypothetical protein